MTLRGRLTLGYSTILLLVLSLFGAFVFLSLTYSLISQIENGLIRTADEILQASQMPETLAITLRGVDLTSNVFVQLWNADHQLVWQSGNMTRVLEPFDAASLASAQNAFSSQYLDSHHVRVLSVPLVSPTDQQVVGHLQLAAPLDVLDRTQQTLLITLIGGGLIAVGMAGLFGYLTARAALMPLDRITATAVQITRADDLSRRIPSSGMESGEVGSLIAAFNDTLMRLENLFLAQRRFLADVSHELRTPLTVIHGNVDLMRRVGADEESLNAITSEVDRMSRMVNDLLMLAKAETGHLPLAMEVVELDTLMLEVFKQAKVLAKDRITILLGAEDQACVMGDRDRLKQVLLNLVANALDATPNDGRVGFDLATDGKWAKLSISDTGPGIPEEEIPHIFERFYRIDRSRKRSREGGAGLGLAIAYWITRMHGGELQVHSQVGVGSKFVVCLPLESQE